MGLVARDSISSGLDTGGDIKKQKAGEVMETTVNDGPHMRKAERRLFGAVQCSEKTFRALANHESTHAGEHTLRKGGEGAMQGIQQRPDGTVRRARIDLFNITAAGPPRDFWVQPSVI